MCTSSLAADLCRKKIHKNREDLPSFIIFLHDIECDNVLQFEWRAREVCLLQNNFSKLWLINSLNEWTIHHCAKKKKWQKLPSLQYDNMHQFQGATQTNWASVLWLVRYSPVWKQPHWPKDQTAANQTAALEWCRSTVHLMILVFFLYIYQDWFKFVYLLFF